MRNQRYKNVETSIITIFIVIFLVIISLLANLFWGKVDDNGNNLYVAIGTLLLALVTGTLAFFSWLSINEGNKREKRDKKERLLNEIIEWAIDAAKCGLEREGSARLIDVKYTIENFRSEEVAELELSFKAMSVRNKHIKVLASSFNQPTLENAVDALIANVSELRSRLEKFREATQDISEITQREVADGKSQLDKAADKVVEEAAKIKTGDIGIESGKEDMKMPEVDIGKELANLKCLIKRSSKISAGRTLLASGLPVFGIGFAQWIYGIVNIEQYEKINASEFYMLVIGGLIVGIGLYIIKKNPKPKP